ncbi:YesL family protein [Alkalibacterium psychrotolerans]
MEYQKYESGNSFMKLLEWIMTLAYLNILWLGFTLVGFIFFGFGPATIAVYRLIRKKLRQGDLSHIFKKFRTIYKEEFKQGGIYTAMAFGAAAFLYVDFRIVEALPQSNLIQLLVIPALLILTALVIVLATFTLGYYAEYGGKMIDALKNGFWVTLISPISIIVILHAFLLQFFIMSYIPGLFLFFSLTLYAFITEWIMNKAFKRINVRKKSL